MENIPIERNRCSKVRIDGNFKQRDNNKLLTLPSV